MVRLSKDAQPRAAADPAARLRAGLEGLSDCALRLESQLKRMRAARRTYTCPLAERSAGFGPACGRRWDRTAVPAPELRADVWDHLQAAHRVPVLTADMIVQQILECR